MDNAYTVIWVCWGGRRKVRKCVSGFISIDLSQERCHIYWERKQGCEGHKQFLWAVFLWNWFWKAVFVMFDIQVHNNASYWTDCPSKPCFHSCQIKKWRLPLLRSIEVRNIEMAALLLNKIGQGSKFKPSTLCVCVYACRRVYVRVCLWAWMSQLCGILLSIIM